MNQLSGLTLAYIGDAIYETLVREYLIIKGYTKVDNLHKEAVRYTSAPGQERAYNIIEDELSEEEVLIFKRGRNAKTERKARNASIAQYKKATGLESLFGYLHLHKKFERMNTLFEMIVRGFENEA